MDAYTWCHHCDGHTFAGDRQAFTFVNSCARCQPNAHPAVPDHSGSVRGLREQLHTPASTVSGDAFCHGNSYRDALRIYADFVTDTLIRVLNARPYPAQPHADRKDDRGPAKADDRPADTAAKPDDHRDRCAKCDAYHSLGYPEPEPATADPGW